MNWFAHNAGIGNPRKLTRPARTCVRSCIALTRLYWRCMCTRNKPLLMTCWTRWQRSGHRKAGFKARAPHRPLSFTRGSGWRVTPQGRLGLSVAEFLRRRELVAETLLNGLTDVEVPCDFTSRSDPGRLRPHELAPCVTCGGVGKSPSQNLHQNPR
jgi:hypothetical protein